MIDNFDEAVPRLALSSITHYHDQLIAIINHHYYRGPREEWRERQEWAHNRRETISK